MQAAAGTTHLPAWHWTVALTLTLVRRVQSWPQVPQLRGSSGVPQGPSGAASRGPPTLPPEPAEPEEAALEPQPEPAAAAPESEPEPVAEPEAEPLPMPATVGAESALEPSLGGRLRSLLRRREPESEEAPVTPPRHVKLLPRRESPEPSRASREVAELFGGEEPDRPEESAS